MAKWTRRRQPRRRRQHKPAAQSRSPVPTTTTTTMNSAIELLPRPIYVEIMPPVVSSFVCESFASVKVPPPSIYESAGCLLFFPPTWCRLCLDTYHPLLHRHTLIPCFNSTPGAPNQDSTISIYSRKHPHARAQQCNTFLRPPKFIQPGTESVTFCAPCRSHDFPSLLFVCD